MRVAILIGASHDSLQSPVVPLRSGRYAIRASGLVDTSYDISINGHKTPLLPSMMIDGGHPIQLIRSKEGTEKNSICIFAERIKDGLVT